MEIWDAYDINFNKLNDIELVRGEDIPQGVLHLVCDIIVKHVDGDYLLMKRDLNKKYGGMWEATAGGSALKGETPLVCAKRELFEETGIKAINIQEIGRLHSDISHYVEFLCYTDCDKNSVVLQDMETIDYKWVSVEELNNMNDKELCTKRIQQFIDELENRN